MAFNLENMTIDYKTMFKMVPSDRLQVAQSGAVNDLISSLTPGQLANLFPRYYREQLPSIGGSIGGASLGGALSGGTNINRPNNGSSTYRPSDGGGGGGSTYKPTVTLPSKSAQEMAVESILKREGIIAKKNISTTTPSIARIMATIKGQESGGNYVIPNLAGDSSATGAFQFTKGTWQGLTKQFGIGTEYSEARLAPPEIQDKIAEKYIEDILKRHNGDVSWIPREWFAGPKGYLTEFEQSKNPTMSLENYISNWMAKYEKNASIATEESSAENIRKLEEIKAELVPLSDDIRKKLDSKTLEIYDKAGPEQKWNIEHAITAVGVDKFNEQVEIIAKTQANVDATAAAIAAIGDTPRYYSEKDPRQLYRGNKAVAADDEIWNHVHPDLARDRDRIYAGGEKIRTGAILAADAAFRYAATKGVPMRVAVEGGVDSHSANHLKSGVGEALDIKPGRRDEKGRDVGESNTWKQYELNPIEIANVSAGAIQNLPGGVARIGVAGPDSSSGVHTQDTGNEGLGIHESLGGMSWAYGSDPYGAGRGGQLRQDLQSGKIGKEYKELVDSLYAPEPTQTAPGTDPVTSALSRVEGQPSEAMPSDNFPFLPPNPTPLPVDIRPSTQVTTSAAGGNSLPIPRYANGGTVPMAPGENVVGINTTTGKAEFMSNDRELYTKDDQGNLRIDPSTIKQNEPPPPIQVETQREEKAQQPEIRKPQQPMPADTTDPNFSEIMTSGSMASSPSQLRALNRAKLYSENSSNLVNGHFS